ncbi:hypothetical protein [Agriterribacter sp.]|uniref:hypothetical protein n=1 Tax=Agriterribacter sp. TaxID=2821509 RepID=UPI002C34DE70|nr:hypothetical protein [Agriterribacter sp.]HTN06267.1 hypothetical protein [Agriterribacter sp.]
MSKDQYIVASLEKRHRTIQIMTEEENINQLPEGWKWVKLGEVCHTTSGGTPSRREPNVMTI